MLADDTGGIAVVNQNDFDKALKRIDADSSDYYCSGITRAIRIRRKRRRKIDVKVTARASERLSRKEYLMKRADASVDRP